MERVCKICLEERNLLGDQLGGGGGLGKMSLYSWKNELLYTVYCLAPTAPSKIDLCVKDKEVKKAKVKTWTNLLHIRYILAKKFGFRLIYIIYIRQKKIIYRLQWRILFTYTEHIYGTVSKMSNKEVENSSHNEPKLHFKIINYICYIILKLRSKKYIKTDSSKFKIFMFQHFKNQIKA